MYKSVIIVVVIFALTTILVFSSSTSSYLFATSKSNLPKCDGSYQDCETDSGFVCKAGSTEDSCELDDD
jgi:hypothetical protein